MVRTQFYFWPDCNNLVTNSGEQLIYLLRSDDTEKNQYVWSVSSLNMLKVMLVYILYLMFKQPKCCIKMVVLMLPFQTEAVDRGEEKTIQKKINMFTDWCHPTYPWSKLKTTNYSTKSGFTQRGYWWVVHVEGEPASWTPQQIKTWGLFAFCKFIWSSYMYTSQSSMGPDLFRSKK